jgi:primary-amine oxidase
MKLPWTRWIRCVAVVLMVDLTTILTGHNLWITAYDPDERYAAGDTPNQNPGVPGLPQYVANNQNLQNTDLVMWLTVGFHHVPSTEDFPVLPRETLAFTLKPMHFFDRNPALDLRRAPFETP